MVENSATQAAALAESADSKTVVVTSATPPKVILCEVCGHANPENTAMCKMCSNYLEGIK